MMERFVKIVNKFLHVLESHLMCKICVLNIKIYMQNYVYTYTIFLPGIEKRHVDREENKLIDKIYT